MIRNIVMTVLMIAVFVSCRKTEEQMFESAVSKYNRKQDQKSTVLIADKFLEESRAVPFHKEDIYFSGIQSIIVKRDPISLVVTSDGIVEEWGQNIEFSHYLPSDKRLIISDGISAELYQFTIDENGERQTIQLGEFRLADSEKSKISALFMDGGAVYYVKNFSLYSMDTVTKKVKHLLGKSLSSPVKASDAKVSLKIWPGVITVAIGNGGSYHLFVIRNSSNPSLIKKMTLPSPFVSYAGEKLLMVTGRTGHWKLSQMDVISGAVKDLRDCPELRDIRTSGTKVFFVEGDALHITDAAFEKEYEQNTAYVIIDKTDSHLLVANNKGLYAVSTDEFVQTTERYRELMPDFFERASVQRKKAD